MLITTAYYFALSVKIQKSNDFVLMWQDAHIAETKNIGL